MMVESDLANVCGIPVRLVTRSDDGYVEDIMQHWFWLGLSVSAVGWYLAVTVYVAIRGAKDIKQMFRRLEEQSKL